MVPSFFRATSELGWKVSTVGKLLEDNFLIGMLDGNHGNLYPRSEEFSDQGVPYIAASSLIGNRVDFSRVKHLPEDRASLLKKGIANDGDVLFAHNATVGPVALVETDLPFVILSTSVTYYRCNPELIHNKYLLAYLESEFFQRQVERIMRQTTRSQVPITAQRQLWVALPPLAEQRKIADILSTWDRAIEATEALLATARTQKRALMQSLLTGKRRFPEFEGEEWREVRLGDVADCIMGSSPKSSAYNQDGIGLPLIQGNADIRDGKSAPRSFTSEITTQCEIGDILMSVRAPVGSVAVSAHQACIGRGAAIIRPKPSIDWCWLKQVMLDLEPKWAKVSQGSTFDAVNSKDIKSFKVNLPSTLVEQQRIGEVLANADAEIADLAEQIQKLRAEKKALMQQLLTGKRRVVVEDDHGI